MGLALEAPTRQLHAHGQQCPQLLCRRPPGLGDEQETEALQARLLELRGAVLGAVVRPQQPQVALLLQECPA